MTPQEWPYPPWAAHRGAGELAPENTLAAIRLGASFGYRMFEFDARLSADGVAILMHDATLERTTDGRGAVAATDFARIARLDAGAWHSAAWAGEPVPTLAHVAHWLLANGAMANIEIKACAGRERETGTAVAREAWESWRHAAVAPLLSSFSEAALAGVRDAAPELPRALLFDVLPHDWIARCRALECVALGANQAVLSRDVIARAHDAGLRVLGYTVNDPDRAARLLDWGLDTLITDAVDRMGPMAASPSEALTRVKATDRGERSMTAVPAETRMPLSESQLSDLVAQIRQRLTVLEEEIARKLGETSESFSTFDRIGDTGDLSSILTESEVDLSEAMRDIEEWRGLRASLRRVDEGTYGVCTDCGVDIPFERLEAAPLAYRCIDCQVRAEHRERTFPGAG